jgi:hypothetical protein
VSSIEESVALLIALGHVNAWNYGFHFFQVSLGTTKILHETAVNIIITAVGKLFGADKKK